MKYWKPRPETLQLAETAVREKLNWNPQNCVFEGVLTPSEILACAAAGAFCMRATESGGVVYSSDVLWLAWMSRYSEKPKLVQLRGTASSAFTEYTEKYPMKDHGNVTHE